MTQGSRILTTLVVAVAVCTGFVGAAHGDESKSEKQSREGASQSEPKSSNEEEGSGDEEMTEEEREKWKKRRARARAIAVRDAAAPGGWLKREWTWDFNYELGIGLSGSGGDNALFSRVRTGVTRIVEPNVYVLGFAGELGHAGDPTPALGLQAESLSLQYNFWLQGAFLVDVEGETRLGASLGWQIFGLDLQLRPAAPSASRWGWFAKIRVPVNWIARAFSE